MSKVEITYEQAVEVVEEKKATLKTAKAEAREFRKENKLRPDDEPADEKVAKKLGKVNAAVEKAQKELDEAMAKAKELKPKTVRESQYDYPEGMTAQEKKKFRAKARAEARRAEKAATEGESPKKEKKEKAATEETAPKKRRVSEDD
jgi:hypothetical protein